MWRRWNPYKSSPHRPRAVLIRKYEMIGYYDYDDDHYHFRRHHNVRQMKWVGTVRRCSSVGLVLRVIILYASVDVIVLLPVLILINVVSIWHVLSVFTDTAT